MTDSEVSIRLERSPIGSGSEAEAQQPHGYLVERLKYENLLKEEAIFKASELIQELKEEADMLRRANHQLSMINANKTTEIRELERMLRGCYRENRDKEVEQLVRKLHEKDLKIRKLQLIIRNSELAKSEKEAEQRYRTASPLQNRGTENRRRDNQICKTQADEHSPNKHPFQSTSVDKRHPDKKYFSTTTEKVSSLNSKHTAGSVVHTRATSTTKKKQPQRIHHHQRSAQSKTEPALAELEIQVNMLRDHIEQKNEQILLLMKRNKAMDVKHQTIDCSHGQQRYRNAKDYHMHKIQSHTTSSSLCPC